MNKELQDRKEDKDPQEVLVPQEPPARRVRMVTKDRPEVLVRQGLRVHKVHKEIPEVLDLRVRPDHKALKETPVQ